MSELTRLADEARKKSKEKTEDVHIIDRANVIELRDLNKRLYEIAQQYGSNTTERYNLLTAYDRIFDGIEEITSKYK